VKKPDGQTEKRTLEPGASGRILCKVQRVKREDLKAEIVEAEYPKDRVFVDNPEPTPKPTPADSGKKQPGRKK